MHRGVHIVPLTPTYSTGAERLHPWKDSTRPSPASTAGGTSGPRPRFGGEKTKELLNKSSIIDRQKGLCPRARSDAETSPCPGVPRGVPPPVPRAVPPCSGLSPGGVTVPRKAASTRYRNTGGLLMVFPRRHHRKGGYKRTAPSTGGKLAPVGSWDWRWEMRSHP